MTASRALGVTYVNTTGRPIMATVSVRGSTNNQALHVDVFVNGVYISHVSQYFPNNSGYVNVGFAVIPNGASYQFLARQSDGIAAFLEIWSELR